MRKLSFLPIAALLLASCNGGSDHRVPTDSSAGVVSDFASHQFDGVFSDTMPCADCSGIITSLNLEADSTFILEQEYVGLREGDRVFYQLGKWSLVDSLLRLSDIAEGPRQFKIVNTNELKMLDNEGGIVTGTNLNFILHRTTTPFKAKKPMTIRGMVQKVNDSLSVKICAWKKVVPLEITTLTQWPDSTAPGLQTGVLAEIEGYFQIDQAAKKPVQYFSAGKFLKYLPNEKCKD